VAELAIMNGASRLRDVVAQAFVATHDGRSTDDVVIDDSLNAAFIEQCRKELWDASPEELNWALLNLRKAASLGPVASLRRQRRHGDYCHAAEIAARHVEDKFSSSLDRVLCSQEGKREFDELSQRLSPGVPVYFLRKAALMLRKCRKLRPELIKRVADWETTLLQYSAEEVRAEPILVPSCPGIYIFSNATGYLYIGEASDLRARVRKHLDHSDRKALARYLWEEGLQGLIVELHAFARESNGRLTMCRRAYESDLIKTRQPRFNIKVS
jgi:predicted GIY-YIG superfamily endonuclease